MNLVETGMGICWVETMAAIVALADYGSDSNDSEEESKPVSEDATLHLKPLDRGKAVSAVKLFAAPVVAVKVC